MLLIYKRHENKCIILDPSDLWLEVLPGVGVIDHTVHNHMRDVHAPGAQLPGGGLHHRPLGHLDTNVENVTLDKTESEVPIKSLISKSQNPNQKR